VGGAGRGREQGAGAHLVDELHHALAVYELHRPRWCPIEAARVWPEVGLGDAHQVDALGGALGHAA